MPVIQSHPDGVSHLLSALEAAARHDIYWSNEHFYRWLAFTPQRTWRDVFARRLSDDSKRLVTDEVQLAKEQPLVSLAQAEHMREVLAGTRPRANEHFEILVDFARTMYSVGQLDPSLPQVNLGDTLTAFSLVPQSGEDRWIFDTRIDTDAFAKLQFRETSVGIGKTQRENREGWRSHAQKNRAFIEDVVGQSRPIVRTDIVTDAMPPKTRSPRCSHRPRSPVINVDDPDADFTQHDRMAFAIGDVAEPHRCVDAHDAAGRVEVFVVRPLFDERWHLLVEERFELLFEGDVFG